MAQAVPDGSMMRFILFLFPTSSATSLNKVTSTIKHHIFSKATETVHDLDKVDLFNPKEYLSGKIMQQAIVGRPCNPTAVKRRLTWVGD